jgi:hypothetical protein
MFFVCNMSVPEPVALAIHGQGASAESSPLAPVGRDRTLLLIDVRPGDTAGSYRSVRKGDLLREVQGRWDG